MNIQTVGLKWDAYTPGVEGQITRDLIALQSQGPQGTDLSVACADDSASRLLNALGIQRGEAKEARLWITYRTEEPLVQAPEHASTVIERDLYVAVNNQTIDTEAHPGYYMQPQGRVIPQNYMLNKPMPNPNGRCDPMVILLWGN